MGQSPHSYHGLVCVDFDVDDTRWSQPRDRRRGLEQGLTMSDNIFTRGEPIDHLKVTIYDGESSSDCENRRLGLQLRG